MELPAGIDQAGRIQALTMPTGIPTPIDNRPRWSTPAPIVLPATRGKKIPAIPSP